MAGLGDFFPTHHNFSGSIGLSALAESAKRDISLEVLRFNKTPSSFDWLSDDGPIWAIRTEGFGFSIQEALQRALQPLDIEAPLITTPAVFTRRELLAWANECFPGVAGLEKVNTRNQKASQLRLGSRDPRQLKPSVRKYSRACRFSFEVYESRVGPTSFRIKLASGFFPSLEAAKQDLLRLVFGPVSQN